MCDLRLSDGDWEWLVFVAVDRDHPCHGCRFVQLPRSNLALYHVTHVTGCEGHDARWWFIIEESGAPEEDAALQRLLRASDELNAMMMAPDAGASCG